MSNLLHLFARNRQGSVAVMFGFVALVLIGVVGAAFDYSRLALVQTSLQRAVDGAVLIVARNRSLLDGYSMSDAIAAQYIKGTFDLDQLTDLKITMSVTDDRVRLEASGQVKMTLSSVLGFQTMPVRGTAEALFGDTKVEIALVLDNTGSMAEQGKLDTLKAASKRFLRKMQSGTGGPDSVKIAIVPFDTDVNLGGMKSAAWVDPASRSAWASDPAKAGCIWDREQPYDVSDTPPTGGLTAFSADTARSGSCSLAPILPLTTDFTALNASIDGMVASGNTNTTIGLAWGLHVLTPGEPVTNGAPFATKGLTKYIIFMTDGDNTQNRQTKNQVEIDTRTRRVCETIRDAKIQVFTAKIIKGNANLLRECATSPDMFYEVLDVAQLDPVFEKIYALIVGTRISR